METRGLIESSDQEDGVDEEPPLPHVAQRTDQEECDGAEDRGAHANGHRACGRVKGTAHRHPHAQRQEHEDQQENEEHDGQRFHAQRILTRRCSLGQESIHRLVRREELDRAVRQIRSQLCAHLAEELAVNHGDHCKDGFG